MDSPFFGSQWNLPSRTHRYPAARQVPVHGQMPVQSPKVVPIPVHFVRSEGTRTTAAVKIQKVLRGFLVRKNMKRIVAIKREVDEIDRRISREEIVDLIRRDSKERLKLNETLMSLLFRLDSVRGVDSAVRDCRKSVIRRAIALQEKVDAISVPDQIIDSEARTETSYQATEVMDGSGSGTDVSRESSVAADGTLEIKDSTCEYSANRTFETAPDLHMVPGDRVCLGNDVDGAVQSQNPVEPVIDSGDSMITYESSLDCSAEAAVESKEEMDLAEIGDGSELKANEEISAPKETVEDRVDCNVVPHSAPGCCHDSLLDEIKEDADAAEVIGRTKENMDVTEVGVDSEINSNEEATATKEIVEDPNSTELVNECLGIGGKQGGKKDKEFLEKMMEENDKLMGLMMKLLEKNETQTRLLNSLSQRVEQLERAFLCEKLRKKKRQAAAGQEASPDPKKCGKKLL